MRNVLSNHVQICFSDDSVRCQHTSSPLGNGAIIETSDRKILVLKRSNNVGEFPGHFVFPGGHPEVINLKYENYVFSLLLDMCSLIFNSRLDILLD